MRLRRLSMDVSVLMRVVRLAWFWLAIGGPPRGSAICLGTEGSRLISKCCCDATRKLLAPDRRRVVESHEPGQDTETTREGYGMICLKLGSVRAQNIHGTGRKKSDNCQSPVKTVFLSNKNPKNNKTVVWWRFDLICCYLRWGNATESYWRETVPKVKNSRGQRFLAFVTWSARIKLRAAGRRIGCQRCLPKQRREAGSNHDSWAYTEQRISSPLTSFTCQFIQTRCDILENLEVFL